MEKAKVPLTEDAIKKSKERFSKRRENRPTREEVLKIVRKNKAKYRVVMYPTE